MITLKYKLRIELLLISIGLCLSFLAIVPQRVSAAAAPGCYVGGGGSIVAGNCTGITPAPNKCYFASGSSQGITPFTEKPCADITVGATGGGAAGVTDGKKLEGDCKNADLSRDCGIVEYLRTFVKVLSGVVGIVIVIMIAVGGIQYSAARDNPQAVAAARGRITNAVIALISFIFMFSVLQWLVPGGVL